MDKDEVLRSLNAAGVIVTLDSAEDDMSALQRLAGSGFRALEMPVERVAEWLAILRRDFPNFMPGATGVSTAQQAWEAVEAGARFVTAAPLSSEIAAVCEAAGVPVIALVDGMPAVEAAMPVRPDFIRFGLELGLLPPASGPSLVLDVPDLNEATIEAANLAGAGAIAVSIASAVDSRGINDVRSALGRNHGAF